MCQNVRFPCWHEFCLLKIKNYKMKIKNTNFYLETKTVETVMIVAAGIGLCYTCCKLFKDFRKVDVNLPSNGSISLQK